MTICTKWKVSGTLKQLDPITNLAQSVDGLLIAHGVGFEVVLGQGHDETSDGESDSLDQASELADAHKTESSILTYQVVVVHDGHDAKSPVGGGDHLGVLAIEPEQGEGGLFLDERSRCTIETGLALYFVGINTEYSRANE